MADLSSSITGAFGIVANLVPGTMLSCAWTKVTGSIYSPELGRSIETTETENFVAIRSNYSAYQIQNGIQAGDVRLIVDSLSLSTMPPVGAVITCGSVAHEVVDAKDYAGIAYELQMRRK